MSDQKKFEQMAGQHVDRQLKRKWQQEYEPEAVKHFTRPANVCEICGKGMYVDPQSGKDHQITEWERKWSVHRKCAEAMHNQLDRQTGIVSERRR